MAEGDSFVATLRTATQQETQALLNEAVKTAGSAAVAVTAAEAKPIAPGVERWNVKVGADPTVTQVKNVVADTSVRELGALPRPSQLMPAESTHPAYDDARIGPVETTVWRVRVQIIALRMEQDGDYHLVLQDDSGATLVAEVPLPSATSKPRPFVPASSPFFKDIQSARAAVDAKFGPAIKATAFVPSIANADSKLVPVATFAAVAAPSQSVDLAATTTSPDTSAVFATRITPAAATVTGVGFFDYDHGQTGNAPNILELHPVLNIDFT